MRVAIIGNSGSGKSTLAQRAAGLHRLAQLDLDTIAWKPGETPELRETAEAAGDVRAFCESHERWVVEGCYAGLVHAALEYSPVLLFLEPGVEACLADCQSRPWEPHKYSSKAEQDDKLEFLLAWVQEYYSRQGDLSILAHQQLFDAYAGPKRKLTAPDGQEVIDDLNEAARLHAARRRGLSPVEQASYPRQDARDDDPGAGFLR